MEVQEYQLLDIWKNIYVEEQDSGIFIETKFHITSGQFRYCYIENLTTKHQPS